MAQFRKRLVIDAVQFNGSIEDDLMKFFEDAPISVEDGNLVIRRTSENIKVRQGNWIIKGVEGGEGAFYSCNPEVFEATYEPIVNRE